MACTRQSREKGGGHEDGVDHKATCSRPAHEPSGICSRRDSETSCVRKRTGGKAEKSLEEETGLCHPKWLWGSPAVLTMLISSWVTTVWGTQKGCLAGGALGSAQYPCCPHALLPTPTRQVERSLVPPPAVLNSLCPPGPQPSQPTISTAPPRLSGRTRQAVACPLPPQGIQGLSLPVTSWARLPAQPQSAKAAKRSRFLPSVWFGGGYDEPSLSFGSPDLTKCQMQNH